MNIVKRLLINKMIQTIKWFRLTTTEYTGMPIKRTVTVVPFHSAKYKYPLGTEQDFFLFNQILFIIYYNNNIVISGSGRVHLQIEIKVLYRKWVIQKT